MMQNPVDKIFWGQTLKTYFISVGSRQPRFTSFWIHDRLLDSWWFPGFTMGSWIPDGSWYCAWHGTNIFGTARIIRARHGNPPPPFREERACFLTGTNPPIPPVLERRKTLWWAALMIRPSPFFHSEIVQKWGSHFRPPFEHFWGPQKC